MSLKSIHLRKLLQIFYLPNAGKISKIRAEIRDDIARESGALAAGGDFYGPFWADAKKHAVGLGDLRSSVDERIDANDVRANLYPQLRDGFLLWWDQRRRWTNEPFRAVEAPKGRYSFSEIGATVKVDNFLSVIDGSGYQHFVYPYFSATPELSNEAARLGLWLIGRALPNFGWDEIRLLDVIRGKNFSTDFVSLLGNEEGLFLKKYIEICNIYENLKKEY